VPEDIAIAGFDDLPVAAMCAPPLTTIRQSALAMGKAAVRLLLDQLLPDVANAEMQRHIELPVELVVRESCGAKLSSPHVRAKDDRYEMPIQEVMPVTDSEASMALYCQNS
jgi:hypothetical protein